MPDSSAPVKARLISSMNPAVPGTAVAQDVSAVPNAFTRHNASLNQSVMAKSVKSNRSGLPLVSTISTP
jgi:hypothetical protein